MPIKAQSESITQANHENNCKASGQSNTGRDFLITPQIVSPGSNRVGNKAKMP